MCDSMPQNRPLFSSFREYFAKRTPLFPKIADMRILSLKTPFSTIFRTLMRYLLHREWGYRDKNHIRIILEYCQYPFDG